MLGNLRKYNLTMNVNIILLLPIHRISLLCVKCNYMTKITKKYIMAVSEATIMPITFGNVHSKKETNMLHNLRKYNLTTNVNIILLPSYNRLSLLCVKCNHITNISRNVRYGGQ